jgi:hypothetical protein
MACKDVKSFLDLPPSARRQIYEQAGLLVGNNIVLRRRDKILMPYSASLQCLVREEDDAHRFTYNVLQACRTIHDEVKHIICAENRIIVSHLNVSYGLRFLSRLSPQICSELVSLYVHLYVTAPLDRKQADIRYSNSFDESWIAAWQSAVAYILMHANPRKLSLHLICDTGGNKITESVLQPLVDRPGSLADCHLRLHPSRYSWVCAIARHAAIQAKGLDEVAQEKSFRFLDLSPELRWQILEFTDLVTPCNQAQWSPKKGFHLGPMNHKFCGAQSHNRGDRYWDFEGYRVCDPIHSEITGSFCCAYQSGYSSRCRCWSLPRSLMLVNRIMYEDAMTVFYSRNRIIVLPDADPIFLPGWSSSSSIEYANPESALLKPGDELKRLSASRFITKHVYPTILSNLHAIELVFPRLNMEGFCSHPKDPLLLDWRFAVDHLRGHANLPALKLIVHMTMNIGVNEEAHSTFYNQPLIMNYLASCHGDTASALKPHAAFLEPLKVLCEGGLQRLFIFLEWDWHWSPRSYCPPYGCRSRQERVDDHVDMMEVWLERMVMGKNYDSSKIGKWEEYPSQWMLEYPSLD